MHLDLPFLQQSPRHLPKHLPEFEILRIGREFCGSSDGETLLPVPEDTVLSINPKVTAKYTLAYTIVGEAFTIGGSSEFSAKPHDFEFGKMFWEMSRGLLEEGKIKVHRPSVNKYGKSFEGIVKGMDAMRQGKVSGEKLVFTL